MSTATRALDRASLPPAASAALEAAEGKVAAMVAADLADCYTAAAAHVAELSDLAAFDRMSDLEADDLAHAEDLMAGARAVLAKAGRLDLIGGAS